MNPRVAYSVLVFFIAIGLLIGFSVLGKKSCPEVYRSDLTIKIKGHDFNVQKVISQQQKSLGLGGKNCIGDNQAMLFSFDKPGYYPFWMKDMKFNIDIIWLNARHQVVDEQINLSPSTYPKTFTNQVPATDVLEFKAGRAEQLNLQTGDQLSY